MRIMSYEEKVEVIKSFGFESMSAFAREVGEDRQNLRKSMLNMRNVTMKSIVNSANALNGDLILAMELFADAELKNLKTEKESI